MSPTVVDARWLGYSGIGRVTELFLAGLVAEGGFGRSWVVWGGEAARPFAEALGALFVLAPPSPLARLGQAGARTLPRGDGYLFLHTVRPLTVGRRAVVLLHDTIPVRFAEPPWKRPLQRLFYAVSTRSAGRVLVYSDATATRARADLGLDASRIDRIRLTVDLRVADAARERRSPSVDPYLLYVGLDRPQKNLEGALRGFAASHLAASGGRFVLVGIQEGRLSHVGALAARHAGALAEVRGRCSDEELVELYRGAAAVIVPSFEEGFGLPVVEALAAGVPVCCSDRTATVEAARGMAELFDPSDSAAIATGIDRAVATGRALSWPDLTVRFRVGLDLPSPSEFAHQFVEALDRVAAASR